MSVESIPGAWVQDLLQRLRAARERVTESSGAVAAGADEGFWQDVFERNAAEVLREASLVTLPADLVVRYRYFGMRERDLLVRPFVARATTDVSRIRQLLDWHAPPDARSADQARQGTAQDVDLLYRHFRFPRTPQGYFEYWVLMQELWASRRWAFAHVITSAEELSQITAMPGWEVVEPVRSYQPAAVLGDSGARLAVLVQSPLERFAIHLEQIEIGADQAIRYAAPVLVASGPKGYFV